MELGAIQSQLEEILEKWKREEIDSVDISKWAYSQLDFLPLTLETHIDDLPIKLFVQRLYEEGPESFTYTERNYETIVGDIADAVMGRKRWKEKISLQSNIISPRAFQAGHLGAIIFDHTKVGHMIGKTFQIEFAVSINGSEVIISDVSIQEV